MEGLARRVSCELVARLMGLRINNGQAVCPLCETERPQENAHIRIDESSFNCSNATCGLRGDVIDLVECLTRLSRNEAVEAILRVNAGQHVEFELTCFELSLNDNEALRTESTERSPSEEESWDDETSAEVDDFDDTSFFDRDYVRGEDGDVRRIIYNARNKNGEFPPDELLAVYIRQSSLPLLDKGEENYLGREIASRFKRLSVALFQTDFALCKLEQLLNDIKTGRKAKNRTFESPDQVCESTVSKLIERIREVKWSRQQELSIPLEESLNHRRDCANSLFELKFKHGVVLTLVKSFLRLVSNFDISKSGKFELNGSNSDELISFANQVESEEGGFLERIDEIKSERRGYIRVVRDLAKGNLRLVVHIALKYRNKGLPFLDVLQAGNVGLLTACRKFDVMRGARFSTYATWWIRQRILRELACHATLVRIPVHARSDFQSLQMSIEALLLLNEREPSLEDLINYIGGKNVEHLIPFTKEILSLSDRRNCHQLTSSNLVCENRSQLTQNLEQHEIEEIVCGLFQSLDERQQDIIKRRFGLGWGEEQTLEEVGEALGVTRERIRQIEKKSLEKLQHSKFRAKAIQVIE